MGSPHNIMTGARAQMQIGSKIVGLFTSCSWNLTYDANPAFVLGRYSAGEITYTAQDVITVDATGFRIVDAGPHNVASIPKLQELMNHEDLSISILDRKTNKAIFTAVGVRPMGYGSSVTARGVTEISCRFMGLRASTEEGESNESAGASTLLSGT